jgi:2-polyprenyl-3-methyl-5-hydroxy-6-metoxy-1,4-benzoquinol methylase
MYVQERYGRELTFRHHLEDMESYTGPADGRRLLDVGAYTGVFVEVARESGWDACGVEPSHWAVAEARRHGLPLVEGTLASLDLKKETFDVVTMWDVIEHFADPAAELAQAYDLLTPGGVIAVHTMNVESLAARLLGPRWPWLMDMHLHYFSPRTLAQMLQKVGFDVIWAGAQGRYLRLGYLVTRLRGFNGALGRFAAAVVERFALAEKPLPVNFGDLFTIYARRPHDTT